MERLAAALGAGILSIGAVSTAGVVTRTWKENRELNQTLAVTGSAKRTIKADLGILTGGLAVQGLPSKKRTPSWRRRPNG